MKAIVPGKTKPKISKKEKWKRRRRIALGVGVPLAIFIWWGFQPIKGTPEFGICRTIAEMQVKYPQTLKVTTTDEFDQSLRIFYTHIEPFGNERSEMIECVIRRDPVNGYRIERLFINRKPLGDEKTIEAYNMAVPAILAGKPNLILPPPYKEDLASLKRD